MRQIRDIAVRFAAVWFIEGLSLLIADYLLPGISVVDTPEAPHLMIAMSVALVLAVMNALVRPALLLLTLPLNMLTFGFSTLLVNAFTLMLTAALLPSFRVDNFVDALLSALVLSAVNTLLTSMTSIDDDNSFYQGVVEWLSRRQRTQGAREPGRGIVLLEIDGLSYQRMQRAVAKGWMPTVRAMLEDKTHALSRIDCGLPSQTSSCQAGIMFGDNYDIPAFRWYEKRNSRMRVSNNFGDAGELDRRYSNGQGLLRGGSSVSNLMAGDAEKNLLTMSTLQNQSDEVQRLRQEDLYLFWLNPYVFTRALILTAWDIAVELGQALRQVLLDQRPRVSRLHKAYPVLRAVTNVFLRELSTYMVTLDVIRGAPAIYTTFVGYDEVAHHAGPDTPDAMGTLRAFDRSIRRVRDAIRDKAGRPYDLFLLSDHGQSAGTTFLQRYGLTLAEFIETLAKVKTSGTTSNDTGQNFVAVLAQELKNTTARRPSKRADRVRQSAINRAGRSLQRRVERSPDAAQPVSTDAPVVVCAGGNMAHAYFNLHTGKVTLAQLSAAYPGLLDALAEHEGIGFVVAFDDPAPGSDQAVPIAFGKRGARNLVTGVVAGDDPLRPYGDAELRAGQLLYMAEFPNAGDLIINSTLYPDGHVAAFEELVGSHGGLGGQQTDAFLLHPSDMAVPPTTNSIDLFALLDQRRGLPSPAAAPAATPASPDRRWAPGVLWAGLREWRVWMPRVAQAMALDSRVFNEVKRNRLMTGPALLISLVAFGLAAIGAARNDLIPGSPMERGLTALVVLYMGWAMNVSLSTWVRRRKRKGESSTVSARVLGFALAPLVLLVFAFLPKIGPVVVIVAVLLDTLAFLIAMRSALHTPWTATLAIPIASLALTAVAVVAGWFMLGGIAIAFESLLKMLQRSP